MYDYEMDYYEIKEADIKASDYYKAIRNYILRAYEKGAIIPLDFRGRMRIEHLATERYSIQERAPYSMDDCFDQLIVDLCSEGILIEEHSLGRGWYEKVTEKEVRAKSNNKEEIDAKEEKVHISRRKKKEMKKQGNTKQNRRKSTRTEDDGR